jgi:hypothetical protein
VRRTTERAIERQTELPNTVVSCELPFPSTNQKEQLNIAVEKQEMEAGEEGSQQSVHHPGGICQMHSLSLAQVASLICFLFILYSFIWRFLILPLFCLSLGIRF